MAAARYEYVDALSRHLSDRKISFIYHMYMVAPQYEYVDVTSSKLAGKKISYIYHLKGRSPV